METNVWWSTGGGSLNKEAPWRPLYEESKGGEHLNEEASWRPLSGGAQAKGKI